MLFAIIIAALLCRPAPAQVPGDVYSAWTDTGYHLMMSDNGTPGDPEDDWVCDWEDNRTYTITILD